jgi:hypothetical protein
MTDDLVQFLRARLDEDETLAQNTGQWSTSWQDLTMDGELRDDVNAGTVAYIPHEATRTHIARHDPSRVLREVEARRRILDDVVPTMQADELRIAGEWGVGADPVREASDDLLSLLALPYSDHPDYRSEWAPDQA